MLKGVKTKKMTQFGAILRNRTKPGPLPELKKKSTFFISNFLHKSSILLFYYFFY